MTEQSNFPKAIFLIGTLKSPHDGSNTLLLSKFVEEFLKKEGIESELVQLAPLDIGPGTYTHSKKDEWPQLLTKIQEADIVFFATPIWWGTHSSLIQRVIERLDEIHDEWMEKGKSRFQNKVMGIVVTGDSDGAEHIIGNLSNFGISIGFSLAPFSTITVLWDGFAKKSTKNAEEKRTYLEKTYSESTATAVKSLVSMARNLKAQPLQLEK